MVNSRERKSQLLYQFIISYVTLCDFVCFTQCRNTNTYYFINPQLVTEGRNMGNRLRIFFYGLRK